MADYASQLLGPSADRRRKALPAASTTRAHCCGAGSILSPSWAAKVVPLENRANVSEVSSLPAPDISTPGIFRRSDVQGR